MSKLDTNVATTAAAEGVLRHGPLTGVRIIDLTTIYSGPLATTMLADQGADVIKVEALPGEFMRLTRPSRNGMSAGFAMLNRNKRSLTLNLREASGKSVLWRLLAEADIVAENFRPGVLARMGFADDAMAAHNPRLIRASINGVGATGPYAGRRMYDAVIQAISGMVAVQKSADGTPTMINTLICDKITSLTAAQCITAALYARERTGVGQRIELSMLDASLFFLWPDALGGQSFIGDGVEPGLPPDHSRLVRATADGFVAVMPVQAQEWEGLCDALDLPGLMQEERFASVEKRLQHFDELFATLNAAYAQFTTDEVCERLERHDVPYSRINSREEVIRDPQVVAMNALPEIDHPVAGTLRQARPPAQFMDTPSTLRRGAPMLGEHSSQVLAEVGYSDQEIAELMEAGTSSQAPPE